MSDNPSFSIGQVPETTSPIFAATRQIAEAATGADIIAAVRTHLAPDADRVGLYHLEPGSAGKLACRAIAVWDKDEPDPAGDFPLKVHELIDNQPLVVVDSIYLDEFLAPLKAYMVDTLRATSFAIIPLMRHHKTIGYLELVLRHTGFNDDSQVRALVLAGWQISSVLESLIVTASLESAQSRFEATIAVLHSVAASRQGAALAEAISASVESVLPITHLSVALQKDEPSGVEVTTWYGPELPEHTTFNGSLIQQALQSGESILLDGLNPSAVDDDQQNRASNLAKLIVAPMIVGENRLGTLNFGFGAGFVLSAADRRLTEEIAVHLAFSFANFQMIGSLQRTLEETTTLYSTSLAMTAAQSMEEIFATLLTELATVSGSDRIILYLAGPDPRDAIDYVEVSAVWKNGKLQAAKGQLRYPLDQAPVLSQFPQSRSNLIFNDTLGDMRLDKDLRAFYLEEKVNALALVPLSTGAIWLGAVLAEAHQGQTFTNEQVRVCRSLADQAALALDSQLLLSRRDEVINRERALREISERIREAATVEEILSVTSEQLGKVTGISADKLKSLDLSDSVKLRLTREEREFISSVQNQVELAIDNLNLIETTRDSAEHELALRDIASALNSTLELDEVLTLILNSAGRVVPHDAANVLLVQNGVARVISMRGYVERGINEEPLRALRLRVDEVPNLKQMVKTKQPVAVPDTQNYPGWVVTPETEWVHSYIGAPIYVEDDVMGFLSLDSATPSQYNTAQAERLQAFANQAATAIRNAQLYQSTRLQAAVIGNVATNLQSATGVEAVLETAVRTLSATLGDFDVRLRLTPQTNPPAGDNASRKPVGKDESHDSDATTSA